MYKQLDNNLAKQGTYASSHFVSQVTCPAFSHVCLSLHWIVLNGTCLFIPCEATQVDYVTNSTKSLELHFCQTVEDDTRRAKKYTRYSLEMYSAYRTINTKATEASNFLRTAASRAYNYNQLHPGSCCHSSVHVIVTRSVIASES